VPISDRHVPFFVCQRQLDEVKRRIHVMSKMRTMLIVVVVACFWFGLFFGLSRMFSNPPQPEESESTKNVKQHFAALAKEQRKLFDLEQFYGGFHGPHMMDAIVEFTLPGSLLPKALSLDGFLAKHVNVCQGENGVISVFAVFTRRPPYVWPRALDVQLAPGHMERADLVDNYSSEEFGFYRVRGDSVLEMKSPNGRFKWAVTKDKDLLTAPTCLYRQDLYKAGEWVKSLVAIAN